MIIEKTIGHINDFDMDKYDVDWITMSGDDIARPHQKAKTERGISLGISLPKGEELYSGAVLLAEEKSLIAIRMSEEKVFEIRPVGNLQWAKAAFNMGNMHQKAYLHEDCICVPYDYVLEAVVEALNIPYSITMRKLDGLRANVNLRSGHSHSHSHAHENEHSHSHSHDHDHVHSHKHD